MYSSGGISGDSNSISFLLFQLPYRIIVYTTLLMPVCGMRDSDNRFYEVLSEILYTETAENAANGYRKTARSDKPFRSNLSGAF